MPYRDYPAWTPAIIATIKTKFDEIKTALADFKTNLTAEERKKYFKQGIGREPFVADVLQTAIAHPEAIPADCDIDKLKNVNAINKAMAEIITYGSDVWETLNDTKMLTGVQALNISNSAYKYFKIDAASNAPLSDKVKDLGKVYSKTGIRKEASVISIPAGATIELKSLKKQSRIVNVGATVLTCRCPSEQSGILKAFEDTKIEPGGSFLLPAGISYVIIANDDKDKAGSISVKFK